MLRENFPIISYEVDKVDTLSGGIPTLKLL